ncbi:MAG TPA: YafY family protein [Streptosporangiaceae bacterium]|jgi:predicted DNA-binding transcriptional regulator YafY
MLETSARLLRLLSLLQSPRDWTGGQLAERLGVSARTVRSDVDRLRGLGYPVHATRGAAGGYRLGAGAALPPLLLDDEEAVAVAVGLRTAAGGAVAGIEENALRALTKLEQVLPSRLRRRVNAVATQTVRIPGSGPEVSPEVLMVLAAACRDRERVRFDYRSHDGSASLRDVEPVRLVNWGSRWYLVGWDTGRDGWRTFRADRIEPRTPAGPRFAPRELPDDVVTHVMRGVSSAAWRYRARVIVHAPAATVAARITAAVGTVTPVGEHSCLLETGSDSVDTLVVHLGLLGTDFTVTGPPELVETLREQSERYQRAITPGDPAPGQRSRRPPARPSRST